jgi:tetratricopeptide (TPR) repeat protein
VTKARAIARAGRCLAQLEKEMPRAEALLHEARQLSNAIKMELPDISVGLGLVEYQRGDYDAAERLLEQGWKSATRQPDHWIAYESLSRLVMVLLERRLASAALERCSELDRLAAKLGEGSEAPFAATLHALAHLLLGRPAARDDVERALARLRQIDTKGQLAYALNFAAEVEVEAGEMESAKRRAEEALRAADTVGRRTEIARARSILSRVALSTGDLSSARAHIESIQEDVRLPLALAASTRNTILAQAASLGLSLASTS